MFSNPPLIKLFNCPNPEPNVSTLTDITTQPDIKLAFEHTLSNNRSVTLHTMLIAAAETNTASHHLSVIVTPLHLSDESQMVIGAVAVFHDVTEMKRAEQMRTEFVANVSHELRTPLTSIQGYLATLKEDIEQELHDHVNHYLSVLTRNASQLEHLVNDLLELARLDAGIELELDQIQLREFTERVIETLRINSDNKQQSIEIQCHTPTLVAEPKRIEQVIINLVGNAIKYTQAGSHICVIWRVKGDAIQLEVTDNGPGIPAENLDRLFERFYRVDKSRSRNMGGTGLGLAIVKHIVKAHGGDVSVQSTQGKGTRFLCLFPVRAVPI